MTEQQFGAGHGAANNPKDTGTGPGKKDAHAGKDAHAASGATPAASAGIHGVPAGTSGAAAGSGAGSGATVTSKDATLSSMDSTVTSTGNPAAAGSHQGAKATAGQSEALLGPLTLRDLVALGSVVVIFIGSLLPLFQANYYLNMWNGFSLYFLAIGILLPLLVGALFLSRRLSPGAKIRVGSLSVDQFGSVVASFAAVFFFLYTVTDFRLAFLVGLIGSLGLLASTVAAPWLPFFAADFADRAEVPAHPVARDLVPAAAKPRVAKPAAAESKRHPAARVHGGAAKTGAAKTGAAKTGAVDAGQHDAGQRDAGQRDAGTPSGSGLHQRDAVDAPSAAAGNSTPAGTEAPAGQSRTPDTAAPAGDAVDRHPRAGSAAEAAPRTSVNPAVHAGTPAAGESVESHPAPESIGATVDPSSRTETGHGHDERPVYDAFWFAVDRPRPVVDETSGAFAYNVEPGTWILALQDRGHDFLVQNTEGRVGVLRDLSNIERAPASD